MSPVCHDNVTMSTPEINLLKLFYRLISVHFMSEFVKSKSGKESIKKSQIEHVKYTVNKGGDASLIFTMITGRQYLWVNYFESEAIKIIESL
jgi:hypothetical protein